MRTRILLVVVGLPLLMRHSVPVDNNRSYLDGFRGDRSSCTVIVIAAVRLPARNCKIDSGIPGP